MNTTTASTSFRSRAVERIVRGQPTSDGDGVKLTRVLTQPLQRRLDPFLMLDAFGSDAASDYIGGFPDHPHRGFETVTIMLEGRMRHRDSVGNVGLLEPGSVQWMTAGRGIIHSEMPEQEEGRMAGFQLWVNLAADDKMTAPAYRDIAPGRRCRCTTDADGVTRARDRRQRATARRGAVTRPTHRADRPRPRRCRRAARSTPSCRPGTTPSSTSTAARSTIGDAGAATRSRPSAWRSSPTTPAATACASRRRPARPSRRGCCWSPAGRSASRSRSTARS